MGNVASFAMGSCDSPLYNDRCIAVRCRHAEALKIVIRERVDSAPGTANRTSERPWERSWYSK